ncbi:MAG TPA: DinB family protein [Thermoanaerobaculia bacterium]|nr:DinB family protein [Thermoanaerobaculia bacterium]
MAVVETVQGRRASAAARRVQARLLRQVEEMAALARLADIGEGQEGSELTAADLRTRVEKVSGWSVADHLEHLVLVDRGVLNLLDGLLAGPPPPPIAGINLAGRLVMLLGFIPRGAGRATTPLRPQGMTAEELRSRLAETAERVRRLGPRLAEIEGAAGRRPHLIFGGLTAAQWHRFLTVHHHHHLKIIRDIRSARSAIARQARGPRRPG